MPRPGYDDNVRTAGHVEGIADYIESRPVINTADWPIVSMHVLPSARTMIVRALRELAKTLPTE